MRVGSIDICELRGLVSTPSRIDPERLAALMEGKLSASEAAEVRAELAASDPELVAAFADAAAVSTELDIVKDTPSISPARGRRSIYGWSALATLAAAALVFSVVRLSGGGDQGFSAKSLIAPLPGTVQAPAGDPWSAVRGAGDDLAPSVRAARLGVMIVDLELASRVGDTIGVRRKAATIAALADGLPGAGPLVTQYRAIASGKAFPSPADTTRDRLNDALASLAGREWLSAGAEAEVIRAVAESRDATAVSALCDRAGDMKRKLTLPLSQPAASMRDSLTRALAERPCSADRLAALSSELLAVITR